MNYNINETFIIEPNDDGTSAVTGGTFDYNAQVLTLNNSNDTTVNVSGFKDTYTTGSTLINNVIYFDRNDILSAYTLSLSALSTPDIYITGGTYSNGSAIFTNNSGSTFTVNGFTTPFTGGTVVDLTATTISATTYQGNIVNSILTGIGVSGSSTNGNITLINTNPDQIVILTGSTGLSVINNYPNFGVNLTASTLSGYGITDAYPLNSNPNGYLTCDTLSGCTVFKEVETDITELSATTEYLQTEIDALNVEATITGITENSLILPINNKVVNIINTFITGGTYSAGTISLNDNQSGQVNVSGLYTGTTGVYVPYSGATSDLVLGKNHLLVGDEGYEGSGVDVNGVIYDAEVKISDIGGTYAAQVLLHRHSTSTQAIIGGTRSNSDDDTHIDLTNGQIVLSLMAAGYAGTSYKLLGSIDFGMDNSGTISDTSSPSMIVFNVTQDGSVDPTNFATFNNDLTSTFNGQINAPSFNAGGTSIQFLKGDGSIDSTVYLTGYTYTTGGTYNNGLLRLIDNEGNTILINGFYTGSSINYLTGITSSNVTTALGYVPLSAYTDTNNILTGGTYNNGSISLVDNSGNTVTVNGLTVGSNYLPLSGGTLSGVISSAGVNSNSVNEYYGFGTPVTVTGVIQNTALGAYAMFTLTGGSNYNTAVGYGAMTYIGSGATYNTAVGNGAMYSALANPITGTKNTALGYLALTKLSSGTFNTGLGYNALAAVTTGITNTAVGGNAGLSITSGQGNTLVGYTALQTVTSGNYNVAIGRNQTGIITGSYNTLIGSQITGLADISNTIILADGQGNQRITVPSTGNVIIGNGLTDAGYKLDVNGTTRLNGNTTIGGSSTIQYNSSIYTALNTSSGGNFTVQPTGAYMSVVGAGISASYDIQGRSLITTGGVNSSAGVGRLIYGNGAISATSNNDILIGVDINPTFNNGPFTGVTNYAARLGGDQQFTYIAGTRNISVATPAASSTGTSLTIQAGNANGVNNNNGNLYLFAGSAITNPGIGWVQIGNTTGNGTSIKMLGMTRLTAGGAAAQNIFYFNSTFSDFLTIGYDYTNSCSKFIYPSTYQAQHLSAYSYYFDNTTYIGTGTTSGQTTSKLYVNGQTRTTKLNLITGSTGSCDIVVLTGGTATVSNSLVTANSIINLTHQNTSGTLGHLYISSKTAGTSFTITSTSNTDTSTVSYLIIN